MRVQHMLKSCTQLPSLLISLLRPGLDRVYGIFATIEEAPKVPTLSIDEADTSSATLDLPDGRKLGYAQYGLQSGRAVFYLHGLPGSRIEATAFDTMGLELGARIIAVDRPGYGLSSPHPGRTILDHAKDVEYLAGFLELETYGVLGISGGGPYALACAVSMSPDKLKAVSIVCGLGLPDMGKKGMSWYNWLGFAFGFRYFPGVCKWWFGRAPDAQLHLSDEQRFDLIQQQFSKSNAHPKDVEVLKDGKELWLYVRASRQAFVQGLDGFAEDGRLLSMDFGFRVEDVRPELLARLWYGKLDTNVPLTHGEQIASRLGGNAYLRVEDETHTSLTLNWRRDILKDLVGIL